MLVSRCARLAAVALALGLAAACGGDDGGSASITTTTTRRVTATSSTSASTTSSTLTAASSAEQEIVDRYRAFWDERLKANTAPLNPDHPGLTEYATGKQLENVVSETRRRRDDGLAIRRPENSISKRTVKVSKVEGDVATLQDCAVNDGVIYRVANGEVIDDDVVTQSVRATMRRIDGGWKLEQATLVQEWQGVAGCALAND